MAPDRSLNLQEVFLQHLQDQNVPVTVFLVNGVKLQGYVTHFDKFGVALTRDHHTQFVYKHAIATIHPIIAIQLTTEYNKSSQENLLERLEATARISL
jgi:host factor-I protein